MMSTLSTLSILACAARYMGSQPAPGASRRYTLRMTRWLRERWRDAFLLPRNLLRDLPRRLQRLAELRTAQSCVICLSPQEAPASGRLVRLHALTCAVFDLLGGPEIAQYAMHLLMQTTPLTADERQAIASVLGPHALRYQDVRIAEGGILPLIFRLNGGRAFCAWHTIHLSQAGSHTRTDRSLLVHEATHVMQYERLGTPYIGEALFAQRRLGRAAYDYGGEQGIQEALAAAIPYRAFNREAQAQIAQDYYRRQEQGQDLTAYETYISALRAGAF